MGDQKNNIEEYRAKFFSIYSNLPLSVRDDIVLVLDKEPITWNVAYLELMSNSDNSERIIADLVELEIIK